MSHGHSSSSNVGQDDEYVRDIHALSPPSPALVTAGTAAQHQRSPSFSAASESASSENFTTMSREFNALVLAGSEMEGRTGVGEGPPAGAILEMIGEDREVEETNPLAIVPDVSAPLNRQASSPVRRSSLGSAGEGLTVQRVKKEEVESKISAWQTAKVAKINNRFKREDAIISGCESEEVQKATTWMKKVERKLEERRARALEKMQNDIAKARQKAEEKRASAEAKRGTKVARVLELANLMKAVGRAPSKRSFF